MTNFVVKTES